MPKQILNIVFKRYWNNQELTTFEATALDEWKLNATEQEINYFTKLAIINF